MFRGGLSKPCGWNTILVFQLTNDCLHFKTSCFDDLYPNLEYLCAQSSEICQILDTDQNNASITVGAAPISTQSMSWSTNALLFIMQEIIKSKGLLKFVQS